ncbi:MAG: hypothetical protein JWN15_322 [Firmicutes bacterium]|nr:hypothetical protein [Bacillota bacterium]
MQRLAAILVILLAGLSLLVSTEAYQVARPVNPAQVPIVSTEQGALKVEAGPNNPVGMVSTVGGRLVLNMQKGPAGNNYGLDTNSTYKLNKIIRVTNMTGAQKIVSLTVTGNSVGAVTASGHVGGGAQTNPNWTLPANQFVDVNLTWTTAATSGTTGMTVIVTGQ